jgi:hypothetical protein
MDQVVGPLPGDVVLLNSESDGKNKNIASQSVLTGTQARFTHLAFCTGLASFLHADGQSVDWIIVDELFKDYPGEWRAIRHRQIEKLGREEPVRVINAAETYLGMAYITDKMKFLEGVPLHNETFCSLLIKDVFNGLGVTIFPTLEKPYPVDFQSLPETDPESWIDVTERHLFGRDVVKKHPQVRDQAIKLCETSRVTRDSVIKTYQMHELLTRHYAVMKEFDRKLGIQIPEVIVPEPDIPLKYWDTKKKIDPLD